MTQHPTNLRESLRIGPASEQTQSLRDGAAVRVAEGIEVKQQRVQPPQVSLGERAKAYAFVKQYARQHTENFTVFSWLVPRALTQHVAAVYAFCRAADDLADENARTPLERERALVRLRRMREMLHEAVGAPLPAQELPAGVIASGENLAGLDARLHIAAACTIAEKQLSLSLFDRLLDAFEHDQRVTRAQTWQELVDYSANSATPVGLLVLQLHGLCLEGDASLGADALRERSDALCTALQLTNFWQDVRRDLLERDRIYIPLSDAGMTAEQLAHWIDRPNEPPVRRRMCDEVLGLVQRTRPLYTQGRELLPRLKNRRLAWMIWLFLQGGEQTLDAIENAKGLTLWQRPKLPPTQRASLVLLATLGWLLGMRPKA